MAKKTQTFIEGNYPLAENYIHVYQGQVQKVKVGVHINYVEGHISLIEPNGQNPNAAVNGAKQWIFRRRELEYMQGWQDILSAMKSAVDDATKKLKGHTDLQNERKRVEVEEIGRAVFSDMPGKLK